MTDGHRALRLLRPYRSYAVGTVIAATPGLADRLIASGVATLAGIGEFFADRRQYERAVIAPHVETRVVQ